MKIHNTLSKKKELFTPIHPNEVRMYVCGPTVYDYAHLGHGRSAVSFDIIRRYFIYKGFKVTYVSNYTDIEDKMIERAKLEGITVKELAEKIIPHYAQDYGRLNILPPDRTPRATEFIKEMIELIATLREKKYAYDLEDGVYFDIAKDTEYGKLSGQKLEELQMGIRIKTKTGKRNPADFVLWKFEKPGEPAWDSPFGKGRPGWHIECSAMSTKLLGQPFDIHAGGLDLIFPHHECEIAQSESATKKSYVKYWMHNGFVQVDNEKMSKSLGNFFTLKDIFAKYDPKAVRLFLISTHYRGPINFSDVQLEQAVQTLRRINDFVFNLKTYTSNAKNHAALTKLLAKTKAEVEKAFENDFEVPQALGAIFDMMREANKFIANKKISIKDAMHILNQLRSFDSVLGILTEVDGETFIDVKIESLIKEREDARKEKNFKKADQIRDKLKARGIELIDSSDGVRWRKAEGA